jgi:hypothetical protein
MKWSRENWHAKVKRRAEWHVWFAWYPVAAYEGGLKHTIWLEYVLRRSKRITVHNSYGASEGAWQHEYKEIS